MAPNLTSLATPARTAVVTSEVQNGVVGTEAALPELAQEARREMIPAAARLVKAARAAGVHVVHCTAYRRADNKGANSNARIFRAVQKSPVQLLPGSREVEVIDEIGVEATDLVLTRTHGLNPMTGTDLDPVLRNLGVQTIVPVGVSVNIAIPNLVMDAVNRGYDVVLPRDAVAGIPREYADAIIDNTLSLLALVTTVDELVEAWQA